MKTLPLRWVVGHHATAESRPELFVAAEVPGAVQLDWARAHDWPPHWKGNEPKRYEWMEDEWWTYEARLELAGLGPGEQLWFLCGGIDYEWEVLLNERVLEAREGMFSPVAINLSAAGAREGDRLRVRIAPIPKRHRRGADRWQADRTCKPPCSYGWDWHPRLVPSGIWQEARLVVHPGGRIVHHDFAQELDPQTRRARVVLSLEIEGEAESARVRMLAPDGRLEREAVASVGAGGARVEFDLEAVELWWPHDHGPQPLYTIEWTLLGEEGRVLDRARRRAGFRRVRLVMNEEEWSRPADFPKSRTHPPITLEINGRAIFCRGSNWIPPDIFPARIDRERCEPLLRLVREAHFNLLRCWGGAIVNRECFYELCDELGVMVWTEFPLACLPYEDDPAYLRVLERESVAIIRRVRQHASHVLWCGGNELFNAWSGMTDQRKALRLLNANCYRLDGDIPFLPTAPVDGMAHGHYVFRDKEGREVHEIFGGARATAYTEFGCSGPSPVEVIREVVPAGELWPPRMGTAWETHHGLGAWAYFRDAWLCLGTLAHYFGEPRGLEEMVERGEWLQCEGFKFIYEEARRQKPRCAMALNWCFNEPWPSVANNSLVNWPARPKPAYAAAASACRPVALCARMAKFSWRNGERFAAELWLLNDSPRPVPAARVRATLRIGGGTTIEVAFWPCPGAAAGENTEGPAPVLILPDVAGAEELILEVEAEGRPEWTQRYRLHYRGGVPAPLHGVAARLALNANSDPEGRVPG